MSFLRRVLRSILRPRYFVGTDLEGNRFYEYPSLSDDPLRTRRRVQYKVYEDMWCYIGGAKRLPVQWVSWLSHTRTPPPTLEELRADLERQRRVLQNAAIIQAKDQEERARVSAAFVPAGVEDPHPPTSQGIRTREQDSTLSPSDILEAPPPASHTHDVKQASQPPLSPGLPPIGKDKDWQPESWTPQATRRRGG
ncbi:hypothetical protein BGY98DRAFT_917573 [Russula aff. rugulosa BPL654]|nr:hypothetical protein BGY98DRAFT_917573 [Russula aff. rugulosa BPL654]